MFSNTLKRPAATLAVAAGLLAAAGPASAIQFRDGNDAINVKAAPHGVAVAGPRAHGSDIKAWQTTHQTSGSFMR